MLDVYKKKLKSTFNPSDELILEAIKIEGTLISLVPPGRIDEKMAYIACENNGMAIKCLPKHLITDDLYQIGVKSNPLLIKYMPQRLVSEELWLDCLNRDASIIKELPDEIKTSLTEDQLTAIVQANGDLLQYIPYSQRTGNICLIAAQTYRKHHPLPFIPKKVKTEEICLTVLAKQDCLGDTWKFIPKKYKRAWELIEVDYWYWF